jgi:hypothetical protein
MVLWLAGLLGAAILAASVTVGVINWYAKGPYYVGLSGHHVVVYKGRPGGFLWLNPQVVDRTDVTSAMVDGTQLRKLRSGKAEPTLTKAVGYIATLAPQAPGAAPSAVTAQPTGGQQAPGTPPQAPGSTVLAGP